MKNLFNGAKVSMSILSIFNIIEIKANLFMFTGIVDVYYRCIPNEITYRKCNEEVLVSREVGLLR